MTKTDPATLDRLLAAPKRQTLQAIATADELAAVRRLLEVTRQDTGQSKRVADFLLSRWNATACGGFDPTDLWCVDEALAIDNFPRSPSRALPFAKTYMAFGVPHC